jgi:hypothetical protein
VCGFDVSLATQAELAEFAALRCQNINGRLTIFGDEIESLAGLETIKELDALFVQATALQTVELPQLTVLRHDSQIAENGRLESVSLPGLESVEGYLYILNNPVLESIDLDGLERVAQLSILSNPALVSLSLSALSSATENVFIADNESLSTATADEVCGRVGCSHCLATDTTVCN